MILAVRWTYNNSNNNNNNKNKNSLPGTGQCAVRDRCRRCRRRGRSNNLSNIDDNHGRKTDWHIVHRRYHCKRRLHRNSSRHRAVRLQSLTDYESTKIPRLIDWLVESIKCRSCFHGGSTSENTAVRRSNCNREEMGDMPIWFIPGQKL